MRTTLLGLVLLAGAAHASAASASSPPRDGDALRAQLVDPTGPREIQLAPETTYRGAFVIRRPLRLVGGPGVRLQGDGTGSVVTIETHDVAIEALAIGGSGRRHTTEDAAVRATGVRIALRDVAIDDALFGVLFEGCQACVLVDSRIRGRPGDANLRGDGVKLWNADDSVVLRCVVEEARDVVVWYSRRVTLAGNTLRGMRYGTHFMYAHDAIVRDCRFDRNIVGIFIMYSARVTLLRNLLGGARGPAGIGIGFKDSDAVVIRDSAIVGNTTGLSFDHTPRSLADPVIVERNLLALNEVALRLHGTREGVTLRGNDLVDNPVPVQVEGGGDALGITFVENHWSDYAGYDLDGDGSGDVAHEPKRLTGELTDARPALRFFQGSLAMEALDAVARAVPILAKRRLLVDSRPHVRPYGRAR